MVERVYVQVLRGVSPSLARPFLATADQSVARQVLRLLAEAARASEPADDPATKKVAP